MDRPRLSDIEIRAGLEAAEARGMTMFNAIERAGLVAPGKTEKELDDEIYILAKRDFGANTHWHKRVVRVGANTVCTFYDDPPMRAIAPDDIVYLDLGPVFASGNDQWEADIGRSYALGNDPDKKRLVADLPRLFDVVKAHYDAMPDITGAQLYAFAQKTAADAGWVFGGTIAGHIVGEFPHAQRVPGDKDLHRIAPRNPKRMRDPDDNGNERHWILEIHLVDRARTYGGFYERLL
jgi:Xaa-Pro dipeptidase